MNAVPLKQSEFTSPIVSFSLESFDREKITARVKQLYDRSVFHAFLKILDAPVD